MTSPSISQLVEELKKLHEQGRSLPLNGFGDVKHSNGGVEAFGSSTGGPYDENSDSLALVPFRCGSEHGMVVGVFTGNYKDMGTAVATGACSVELVQAFSSPLLSDADLAPALRKWTLNADARIHEFSESPLEDRRFGTVMGQRSDLRGIGCSVTVVAVFSNRVYGAHIGEGKAYLLRSGQAKKLTMEDTLAHDPGYRVGNHDFPNPETVILKAIGMNEAPPEPKVFRTHLVAGDRIVIGNLALSDEHLADLDNQPARETVVTLLKRIAPAQGYPAVVAAVTL